jgi:hypothetical protein
MSYDNRNPLDQIHDLPLCFIVASDVMLDHKR